MDNFPKRMLKVYDELVLIAQAYGDTVELEKVKLIIILGSRTLLENTSSYISAAM